MKFWGRSAYLVLFVCSTLVFAQSSQDRWQSNGVVAAILKMPAPAPPAGVPGAELPQENRYHAPTFTIPPEDAPLEVIGRYWAQHTSFDDEKPTEATRERLLEACQQYPELLPYLLKLLPETPTANQAIKSIYDVDSQKYSEEWRKKVKQYLELNTEFFRDALVADAASAKDDSEGGYVEHSDELEALVRLDWSRAEPVLRALGARSSTRAACLAHTLTYRHYAAAHDVASATSTRQKLQMMVGDRATLGYCRSHAADALLETEWDGRDGWYISLFSDLTLRRLTDKNYLYQPLNGPVSADPERWIPEMTALVANPDRAVHDAAVSTLVQFNLRSARKDALEPLLPWLMDRSWSSADDRLRLIQTVDQLDMTESIPGLIHVLTERGDEYDRSYAAESLAHFKDSRAVPALRIAVEREKSGDHRQRIIKALIACGGVSALEAADAIEQYAIFTQSPQGQESFESFTYSFGKTEVPAAVSLGAELAKIGPSDETVTILIQRAQQLRIEHPEQSQHLESMISAWPSPSSDRETVRRIKAGTVSPEAIANALERRKLIQNTVAMELTELAGSQGAPAGFAAVLLADSNLETALLRGTDQQAQGAMMASARLIRERLPIDLVAKLLNSSNPDLASAAEAFLETEDSPQARSLVLGMHPNQARIIGARESYDPGHFSYKNFDQLEAQLSEQVRQASSPDEVYALLSAGYWGDLGQIIVHVRQHEATLEYIKRDQQTKSRPLSAAELEILLRFLRQNQVDDLGSLNLAANDGIQYEYIHLTRVGGRRVFMNNPGLGGSGGSVYDRLCKVFQNAMSGNPH